MTKPTDSKEKTVVAAARLFRRHGYHATGLADILSAGGSPRGSLYFHFPKGKEAIGEAALEMAAEAVRRAIAAAAEASADAAEFLIRIIRGMAANLQQSDFTEGCPIATVALETAAQSDALGAAARTGFQRWEQEIRRGLTRFGLEGEAADFTATAALSQLEGALLLARTYRSLEPLHRAEAAIRLLLRR